MNEHIFQSVVKKIQNAKDKDGNFLIMDSLMISDANGIYKHKFNDNDALHDLRSVSKFVIGLTLGLALENGLRLRGELVNLETKIYPFFKNKIKITNGKNVEKLEKVSLKHLLTHTMGYADGLLFNNDIKDKDPFTLLDYLLNYDIIYNPGESFVYSNVGPYIFSALIQEELEMNLAEWVSNNLFQKIGITNFEWKSYGNYCAGATGLRIAHDDLHKVGQILLDKGLFNGQQLVPSDWVESMTQVQVLTPTMYDEKRVFPKYGYGFYTYICKNGNYYIDGTDGQYLIVLKDKGILITTFGHQPDMKPITECFRELL